VRPLSLGSSEDGKFVVVQVAVEIVERGSRASAVG